jgi:hypothetical protein
MCEQEYELWTKRKICHKNCFHHMKLTYTRLVGNIHTKREHKNDSDNITPMFIGLNKTTQQHERRKKKIARERIKNYVLK